MTTPILPQLRTFDTLLDSMAVTLSVNGDKPPNTAPVNEVHAEDAQAGAVQTPADFWREHTFTVHQYMQRPPKEWLLQNVLGVRDVSMMFGESGSAKTFVTLDMLFACASGTTFAGKFEAARQMNVIYCTGEGQQGLAGRLRAAAHYYGEECLSRITILDTVPQLFERRTPDAAMALANAWTELTQAGIVPAQPDVFVLDTMFNATLGADENSAKDMATVFMTARHLRERLGCTVLILHHTNKSGEMFRGSSSIKGELDTMLRTQVVGKRYQLVCEKVKDGSPWTAQAFSLVDAADSVRCFWEGDAASTNGDRLTQADKALAHLQQHAGARFTATQIADAIGLTGAAAKNIYRDLKSLKAAGSVLEHDTGRKQEASLWYCAAS